MANRKSDQEHEVRKELTKQFASTRGFGDQPPGKRRKKPGVFKHALFERITKREIAIFSRQLSLLLDLGITLLRALNILRERTSNRKMQKVIEQIGADVEKGQPLSSAMLKFPHIFGEYFITIVKAGEESGKLDRTLSELADYSEKEDLLRSKIMKALSFPLLTLFIACCVVAFLLIFVIPTFAHIYQGAKIPLPPITRFIIGISSFFVNFWWAVLILIAALWFFFRLSGRMQGLKRAMDRAKLVLPVVKSLAMNLAVFRFARITATMLDSGVPILPTLRLASSSTENSIMEQKISRACEEIDRGKTLEESLGAQDVFPALVVDMIGVGEEAGAVGKVLRKVAFFYERDLEDQVSNIATLIEPILTLILGFMVVVIALSMFIPYFNLNQVIIP
jgi:type IV pilus assembly protein PilC